MVSNIVFVALAALCVSQIAARPEGDVAVHDHLQTLIKNTQAGLETMHADITKMLNLQETKETKEFLENVKANSKIFGDKLVELTKEAEEKFKEHSTDAEKAVAALKEQMTETAKKIEELAPEATTKAKEYQTKLEGLYGDVMAKAKESLAIVDKDTSAFREQGKKYIEEVMTVVKSNVEKVHTDVQKVIAEHTKKP